MIIATWINCNEHTRVRPYLTCFFKLAWLSRDPTNIKIYWAPIAPQTLHASPFLILNWLALTSRVDSKLCFPFMLDRLAEQIPQRLPWEGRQDVKGSEKKRRLYVAYGDYWTRGQEGCYSWESLTRSIGVHVLVGCLELDLCHVTEPRLTIHIS